MDSIRVQGGTSLQGKVRIQGSKNAALPILAAAMMTRKTVILENVPKISDVYGMIQIMETLGCDVKWKSDYLEINANELNDRDVSGLSVKSMRSSVFLLGALLARRGTVRLDRPGGCVIGERPIDLHVKALQAMGTSFENGENDLIAHANFGIRGATIELDFPSVGATENIVMAATAAKGITRLIGAAREPEVRALCEFLNCLGAKIEGAGTGELIIEGGHELGGTRYVIPPDRIVAGTYLLSGFATGGSVFLEDAPFMDMEAVLRLSEQMGAAITTCREGIYVQYPERAGKMSVIKTGTYPGFPTDLQSVALAIRCTGMGRTMIRETIFENRFRVIESLKSMGAKIVIKDDRSAVASGVRRLHGAEVEAFELRGGAALVAAALGADGETVISGKHFIDRGYENICRDFRELGARIVGE